MVEAPYAYSSENLIRTLRKAIRVLNQTFNALKLEKHPGKTSMGKTERSFDFFGYRFHQGYSSVATKVLKQILERVRQLYEQDPGKLLLSPDSVCK